MTAIDFVLVIGVEGLHFHPERPEGIEFIPCNNEGLRFVLLPTDPDLDASGHRNGLTCKVYKSYTATKDQVSFVDSYNTKGILSRVASGVHLPFKQGGKILIAEDGSWVNDFIPRLHMCPSDIIDLIKNAESDLASEAERLLRLIRWRQFCDAPGEIFKHSALYWRVGEGDFPITPHNGDPSRELTIHGMFGVHWSEEHSTDLQELWNERDVIEPLGHTLLREARDLASTSPRSSILMMTTALETAVKMHISSIAPDTMWLMQEIPSPPIFKVLRDYIPLIHRNRGIELDFWNFVKPLINRVQKLTEVRNKVAHTGKIPDHAGPLQDDFELVLDFLYLLDVLEGHEWAKSLVSSELRKTLGWPDPKDSRIKIIVTEGY